MAALASESGNLQASIRELAPTLENANAAFASLNAAFPPTRAFAREILPGVRETPATIDAAFPWIEQMRGLMSPAELQGLARDLSPPTRDLAQLTDQSIELLPQTDLVSKCARDVILPTGDVVIRDEFQTGRENYKDFFYAMVGLAGEGQNFDGNGGYVRFQTGGGSQTVSLGAGNAGAPPQFGGLPTPPLGNRPAYPGKRAAVQARRSPATSSGCPTSTARRRRKTAPLAAWDATTAVGAPQQLTQLRSKLQPFGTRKGVAMTAIRKHLVDFVAIIGLIVIALAVASVILANQRLALPGWMPVLGQDFTEVEAELSSAQAVTPGQGQTVNVAGVEVGEISAVRLEDGKAIVTLQARGGLGPRLQRRERAAAAQDRAEGHGRRAHARHARRPASCEEGQRIPIGQTLPDVNLDEILASLDGDTRTYLQLLLSDGGEALGGNGRALANTIRRFEPTARDTRKIAEQLAERRENIKRVIHNFSLLVEELGAKDDQLAEFVDNSNAVFAALAAQDANLRATLQELPSTLDATQSALGKTQDARRRARPDARGAAARRARARPGARRRRARSCARRRRSSATRSARSCAPRARRCRSCARRLRDLVGAHARPRAHVPGRQPAAQHARLQPARRDATRASCSGPRGSTTSARRSSPTRTRRGRSGAASS